MDCIQSLQLESKSYLSIYVEERVYAYVYSESGYTAAEVDFCDTCSSCLQGCQIIHFLSRNVQDV